MDSKTRKTPKSKSQPSGYCTEYVHYRTRKLMRAKDYGYKAWPFGGGR